MIAILTLLLAATGGCVALAALTDLFYAAPRWASWMVLLGAGTLIGFGGASLLFTVICAWLGQSIWIVVAVEGISILAGVYWLYRKPDVIRQPSTLQAPPLYRSLLGVIFVLILVLATTGFYSAWDSNPQGNWDAWSIWNLRAEFMAADPSLAPRAWSAQLVDTHPEYPLLLSSLVASAWKASGAITPLAPIAAGYLFFLSLIALATGAFTLLRGPTLGLLFGMVLTACPAMLHEVAAQYADVPLAAYILGAVLFLLLDRPVLAGILASLAAWTKQEGQLFVALLAILTLVLYRKQLRPWLTGAAIPLLFVVVFKLWFAPHSAAPSLAGLGHFEKYGTIAAAFFGQFFDLGASWLHPFWAVLVLAVTVRMDRSQRIPVLLSGLCLLGLLAGYFVVYLLSTNDLTWYLNTSLNRLFVQLWPLMLLTPFLALRRPEDSAILETVVVGATRAERRQALKATRKAART